MIYDSKYLEEQAVLHTAERICAAARTAPKGISGERVTVSAPMAQMAWAQGVFHTFKRMEAKTGIPNSLAMAIWEGVWASTDRGEVTDKVAASWVVVMSGA